MLPDDTAALIKEIYALAGRDEASYLRDGDDDFSFALPGLAGSGSALTASVALWRR